MIIRARSAAVAAAFVAAIVALAVESRFSGDRLGSPFWSTAPRVAAPETAGLVRHVGVPTSANEEAIVRLLAQRRISAREVGGTTWGIGFFSRVLGTTRTPGDGRWVRTDLGQIDAVFVGTRSAAVRVCTVGTGGLFPDMGLEVTRVTSPGGVPLTIDRHVPLYFTVLGGTVAVTDSAAVNDALLRGAGAKSVPC